jgi:DNA-binding CsgD family transcriptional regulator
MSTRYCPVKRPAPIEEVSIKHTSDWRERARDMMASTGHSWEGEPVRLLPAPSIPTLLSPRVNPVQVRRLLRLGIILRWVAIAFAGLAGVLTPKPPPLLFYLMVAALIYNLAVMVAAGQATEAGAQRLAVATTVVDQFFDLGFITIYAGSLPSGDQVAPYVPGLIEAVAYFGVAGAILSVAIFFAFLALIDAGSLYVGHASVSFGWVLGATLIVALIAVTLVPVVRILTAPVDAAELAPALRLSRRETDVLRLVAEGYSNTMIASRLNLSDNTVKSYVESLLTHLNARNRAEAVAAASRLKLI